MRLAPQNIARFYRIWLALLNYINAELHLVPSFPEGPGSEPIPIADIVQLRDALWAHDDLRERFIVENPGQLSAADLAIIGSWQYRVTGTFTIVRSLKKYTVFLSHASPAHLYGVLGLGSDFVETLSMPLPIYVQVTLLPFERQITYDTLLAPYNIVLGPGIRSGIQDQYRALQEREGIMTSLLPADVVVSARGQRDEIAARNRKVFTAFRRDLQRRGLSERMVNVHSATIEDFAQDVLLEANPPRGILELEGADVQSYLERHPGAQPLTSFKWFVRFLLNTERVDYDLGEYLRTLLDDMSAGE